MKTYDITAEVTLTVGHEFTVEAASHAEALAEARSHLAAFVLGTRGTVANFHVDTVHATERT